MNVLKVLNASECCSGHAYNVLVCVALTDIYF